MVPSLQRVGLGDWQLGGSPQNLFAAKNEYEAAQLVVRAPRGGLSEVTVEVSALRHASGYALPPASLYLEHYVFVARSTLADTVSSNPSAGPGWYPDGLIPFDAEPTDPRLSAVPFSVGGGRNQPVWIDVYVPPGAPAGDYTATYTVSSAEGRATGDLALTVWDFTLPASPALASNFQLWEADSEASKAVLLAHHLSPNLIPAEEQPRFIEDYGLSAVGLPFWSGANFETCAMDLPPSPESIQNERAKQDPRLRVYAYTADEIDTCARALEPSLKQWARALHSFGVEQLVTMMPVPGLYDDGSGRSAVDIWVISAFQYYRSDAPARRLQEAYSLNTDVWSYTALTEPNSSPKWALDLAPINHRIMPGFINPLYDMTGLLYWRVDEWTDDPWFDLTPPLADYPYGEGMLVYPAEPLGLAGVAPSLRLKWIRDGVEDYAYVKLLEDLGQTEQALDIVKTVARSWTRWHKNPQVLLDARQRLAAAILEAQN